jgi:hypothetical protein
MANCHAAVLLLTPNAIASPWVLKEATILTWRRSLDSSFRLFPVCFPGVDDAMLQKEKFEPLMLNLIQKIRARDPATIADAIRAQVGRPNILSPTPLSQLVQQLEDLLSEVGPGTLKAIAERMSIQTPVWRPDIDMCTQYVAQIARRILSEDLGGFKGVDELIDALSFTPAPDNVKQIFRIVAHYWVDVQAAGRLPPLLTASERRAAALNGALVSHFTANAYVRRAHPLSLEQTVIPIAGGAAGDLVSHVKSEICTWMRNEGEIGSDEQIIEALSDVNSDVKRTYYAVLPPPVDDESLTKIIDSFPAVTFILWTGELAERDETLTRVEWMEPMLDLGKERRAYRSYIAARRILKCMSEP